MRSSAQAWLWLGLIVVLVGLVAGLTYAAGGTKTPAPHGFYIPVVLAAGVFGVRAGLLAAVLAGVASGPLMPLDVESGALQSLHGWLIRLGFFLLVALVVGVGRNRLLALSRARQNLLSTVSHELRTPLAAVVGFASMLREREGELTKEERREFAELILQEANQLSNVVDHYVIAGRLEDSALFIDPRPTEIQEMLALVLDGIPRPVGEQRVRIDGGRVVCRADPLRLRQILTSMINNALAHTSDPVAVQVDSSSTYARVVVTDSESPPVRRPLSRLTPWSAPDTTPSIPALPAALGIGLAASRDLARRMGGDLDYDLNGGTSYRLHLPLVRSDDG